MNKKEFLNFFSLFVIFPIRCIFTTSFTDVSDTVFKTNDEGYIAAYADFNSDKKTDLFVIGKNAGSLYLYLASHEGSFTHQLLIAQSAVNGIITSVVPADFDGDSQTDVLLTLKVTHELTNVEVLVFWGGSPNTTLDHSIRLPHQLLDQPLVLDSNGDLIPDIFGETEEGRFFYYFSDNRTISIEKLTNGSNTQDFPPLYKPQSSAFSDWDGNLTPDLLIVSEKRALKQVQIEIWKPSDGRLIWHETLPGPPVAPINLGIMTVADIDESREMALLFPSWGTKDCPKSCIYVFTSNKWVKVPLSHEIAGRTLEFVTESKPHPNSPFPLPPLLRQGDLNLDGYTDFTVVLKSCNTSNSCEQKAVIILNDDCKESECSTFTRVFRILDSAPITKSQQTDLIPSFFDTKENGKLDILLTTYNSKSDTLVLKAYRYQTDLGSYFLKIMVVSGKCNPPCINGNKAYGTNLPGPTTVYVTQKNTGATQIGQATQLPQSAYLTLQLPYVIYGLGQAPNAIDSLTAGVVKYHDYGIDLNRTWTYVVPNTQMILIPNPHRRPDRWKTRLFMTPSHLVLLTGLALLGTFFLVILIVALLHWREHVADKHEKLQEAQKFHFDAM